MDEVLRRRLIGAAVLLAAAFALASLLPDPGPRGMPGTGRVVTYDLRTGEELGAPEAASPGAEAATAPPVKSMLAPRPALKVDDRLGTPPGAWYLQIGSFESQTNARNVLQKLYGAGLPTTIQSISVGKKLWYRVRVGPYPDEAAAQQALVLVRQQGYALAKVVRPEAPSSGSN